MDGIRLRVFNLLKRNTAFFTAKISGIPQHNYVEQNNNVTASYKLGRYAVLHLIDDVNFQQHIFLTAPPI